MPEDYQEPRSYEQRYTEDREARAGAEPEPPVFKMLFETRDSLLKQDDHRSPEEFPEAERELVMLSGALTAVEQRAAELVARLDPILVDPDGIIKMASAARADRPNKQVPGSAFAVRMADLQRRMSAVEGLLEIATARLAV